MIVKHFGLHLYTCGSRRAAEQVNVPDILLRVLVFLLFLVQHIVWRLHQGQFLRSSDI